MPFPFYPIGALVAAIILGTALTLFALALRAIDRAVTQVGGSVLGGLVSGISGWSEARRSAPPAVPPAHGEAEESTSAIGVEPVIRC
jgi:hypothetical protein